MNLDLTFLEFDQIIGEKQLDIFKRYGYKAATTNLGRITGCIIPRVNYIDEDYGFKDENLSAVWWTKTPYEEKDAYTLSTDIEFAKKWREVNAVGIGARPCISYSSIKNTSSNMTTGYGGVKEVEFGEYPQTLVSRKTYYKLEMKYKSNFSKMSKTGKVYTINTETGRQKCIEYVYEDKKYIRVIGPKINLSDYHGDIRFIDDKSVKKGKIFWFEVQPIKWLVDEEKDIAVTKYIMFAGVPFQKTRNMDESFAKEILVKKANKEIVSEEVSILNSGRKEQIMSEFDSKIQNYLDEINKYLEYVQNKDVIKKQVNDLLDDYNKKHDDLTKNTSLSLYDKDAIKTELIVRLELITNNLKSCCQDNHVYHEILKELDRLINVLNKKQADEDSELINDFKTISDYILPFLKKEDRENIKDKLLDILDKFKNELINYLKTVESFEENVLVNNDIKLEYSNQEEFEINLRKEVNPIFLELGDKVDKRDIEKDLIQGLKEIKENIFDESKNNLFAKSLKEISVLKTEIVKKILELDDKKDIYINKLNEIIDVDINTDVSNLNTMKEVNNMIISLNKLHIELTDLIKAKKEYNNNKLNIKL